MNSNTTPYFDISEQVFIVTGGSRGLGKAITVGLIESGARVAVIAKSHGCDDLKNQLPKQTIDNLFYIPADLTITSQRNGLIEKVINHWGRLDVLVNNAGNQTSSPIVDYDLEIWKEDLELLLTAPFDLSKQAATAMRKTGGGKIINIASISSYQGARNICGYVTAKHGLIGLTKTFAIEMAPYNIQVNAIAPGQLNTGIFKNANDDISIENITSRVPMHRLGEPKELLGAIIFLASNAGSYITGITIPIDGGWLAR